MKNQSLIFLGLVFLFAFSEKAQSQNLYHTGLLFTSAPQPKELRTSLDLTIGSPVIVRNKFSLEFDLAIWRRDQFGYVFRIYDKQHHNIDLVYISKGSTLAMLKLSVNGHPTLINIVLDEKDLIRNNWLHLILSFDLQKGSVEGKLGDQTFKDDKVDLSGLQKLNFCFGVNRSNFFPTADVPNMAIRNIRIADHENKVRHNWLLNESEGEEATDLVGNFTAQVHNPGWIINNHFFWTKEFELRLGASSGVAFDTLQNRIIFIGQQKIVSYDIVTSNTREQIISNSKPSNSKSESYYFSSLLNRIYSVGTIPNQVNVFEESTNKWKEADSLSETGQYINSSFFLNEQTNALYSVGGYNNYRYYDILMRYSFIDKTWRRVILNGDKLVPRNYASVTETRSPGQYYIFGGYGNDAGQQELGPQCLYDLYHLDLNDSTLKKKWTMEYVSENFVPMGSASVNEQNPALYVLGFPPFLNETYLKLYRISLDRPGYSIVSDTIRFYFDEEQSKASLYFFRKTQEFFAVIKTPAGKDSSNFKVFSLTYPPVNRLLMTSTFQTILSNPKNFPHKIYWMVAALSLILIFPLLLLLKKLHSAEEGMEEDRKLNSLVNDKEPTRIVNPDKKQVVLPRKNAIYILGDISIYNSEGLEISHNLSFKLKQLFFSIFLLGSDNGGITNEKLNSIHWTYHTPQSAKNNRNVNIKKLRDVLSSLKGIQIIHEEGSWSIKLSTEVFCDYHFLLKKIKGNFQPTTRDEFEKINHILSQGVFFGDERVPWLDSFKSHFISSLLEYLFLLADSFEKDRNPDAIRRVADLILKSDPLNEEAFKLKIEALVKQKNHNQAFVDYEYFTREYEKMYGISYPLSFKSLVINGD